MEEITEVLEEAAPSVEWYLNNVNYQVPLDYVPSEFSLGFVNFIKLVNGSGGEEHKTPLVHYWMLDTLIKGSKDIANLCHRGIAKTTLMGEYLILYLAVYGELPNFGEINLILYVSDSIENGVKNMRKNLEFRWEDSDFLKEFIPETKFTDIRWEFKNADNKVLIVKGYGAKALSLDSILYTEDGLTTVKKCHVGQKIYGPNGKLAVITDKSEIFNKPMYRILLKDGRSIKVSEDHINSVVINTNPNNIVRLEEVDLTTKDLLKLPLVHTKKGNYGYKGTSNKAIVFVKNTLPLQYEPKEFPIDPYTLGVVLGDGRIQKPYCNVELTTHIDDLPTYQKNIPYEFGKGRLDIRNSSTWTQSIRRLGPRLKDMNLGVHGSQKFIPEEYFYGDIEQRLSLLQGLMDTAGTVTKTGRTSFCSMSKKLLRDVTRLARSLGATVSRNRKPHNIEIWINKPLFKLDRKLRRQRYDRRDKLVAIESIERIEDEPSQCIAIDNSDRQFLANDYFRTHNTGVRGAKELGVRPQLAILDDLVSDEDARSATVISAIEATVNKAVNFALHPKKKMIIWSGTPFNARDPLYKAVESGAWAVNVFPVCETFPCSREEFKGSWPDRFDYDYVLGEYLKLLKQGKVADFNQELMLRIMSDEDRLIKDTDMQWYNSQLVTRHPDRFNFYITTDFATSEKKSSDFSVISVWAYNSNGDWFWVDGICKKQTMDKNIDNLFRLAQMYKPQSVGIEVSGQQGGFIPWIQEQMLVRNIYFTLASENNNGSAGIRPNTNKMERFNVMVPMFKTKKMFFPEDKKLEVTMMEAVDELTLVSAGGMKSKYDDFIDTISMLGLLTPWKPSAETEMSISENGLWEQQEPDEDHSNNYDSYIP